MAGKLPPNPFPKGVSGNPSGRGKDIPGFKALANLTKKELADVSNVLIKGDMKGLRRIADDETAPAMLCLVASVMIKIYDRGDMQAFDMLLNRLIGKVKDELHHGGSIGGNSNGTVVVTLPSNGREVRK